MTTDPIARLLEHGEEHGCIHLTQLNEVVQTLELEEEDIEALFERIEAAGIELTDDCARVVADGRGGRRRTPRRPLDARRWTRCSSSSTRPGRYPLLTAVRGGRAREADRARRQARPRT